MAEGIAGLLTNGLNALILNNPKDATELSEALKKLLSNNELRNTLSHQAAQFADGFAWAELARQQEAVYLSAKAEFMR